MSYKIDTSSIVKKDNITEFNENKKYGPYKQDFANWSIIQTDNITPSVNLIETKKSKGNDKEIIADNNAIKEYVAASTLFGISDINQEVKNAAFGLGSNLLKPIEHIKQRETFKKWISQYENVWLYNYFNGTGSYESVSKYVTKDGKYYIAYDDNYQTYNNGSPKPNCNFGFGIHYWNANGYNNANVQYFKELGIDITDPKYLENGKAKMPVETVEAVKNKVIDGNIETVKSYIGENNYNKLTVEQQYVLIDLCYNGTAPNTWAKLRGMLDEDRSPEYIAENWGRITSDPNKARKEARVELWLNGNYIDASGNVIE